MEYEYHLMIIYYTNIVCQPTPQTLLPNKAAANTFTLGVTTFPHVTYENKHSREREIEILVVWHNLINKRQSLTQRMYRPASETYNQYRRLSWRGSPRFVLYYYLSLLYSYKITSYKNKKVWSFERRVFCWDVECHKASENYVSRYHEQLWVSSSTSLTECL